MTNTSSTKNSTIDINQIVTDLNNKADIDLNNITEISESSALYGVNTKRITNCLLEVPQNIKLELNNGVLTLKAGSKVIVPNGAGVFDEVTITTDRTPASNTLTGKYFLFASSTNLLVDALNIQSGSTFPSSATSGNKFYNTTENKFYRYNGTEWQPNGCSFPLAIVTLSAGSVTSIDQVFNGFGYIGSTAWVDKGVKLLFPNGRNADGTLNNIEGSTQVVKTYTAPTNFTNPSAQLVLDSANGIKPNTIGIACNGYIEVDEIPTTKISNIFWLLHRPSNLVYQWNNTTSKYELKSASLVALMDVVVTSGVITSINIKQPFRAVDYNDYRTEVDSKVSKSGDTLTGPLTLVARNGVYFIQSPSLDYTTIPSATEISAFRQVDKNGNILGDVRFERKEDGGQSTWLMVRNCITGSEVNGLIGVHVTANGTAYTQAPTPSLSDNSAKIATTAYCVRRRCTTKATTTSSASITRPAWIVQNYVNGTSWYRVWSDGWCEQGGYFSGQTNGTVTLLKSFSDTNYTITMATHNATVYMQGNCHGKNTGSFTLGYTGGNGCTASGTFWYACGY